MSKDMFRRVGFFSVGYDPEEVEDFFDDARDAYEGANSTAITGEDIRRVSFDQRRGGYATDVVDAAMDRLEVAFTQRRRTEFIAKHGQSAWLTEASKLAKTLYGRLVRPAGERFAPGKGLRPSYDRRDVDALCDELIAYFDRGTPLDAKHVRSARFRKRVGGRGYSEAVVDRFLDRAVEVMLLVE